MDRVKEPKTSQLHFLMPSYAPFQSSQSRQYQSYNVAELTASCVVSALYSRATDSLFRLFDRKNLLVDVDPRSGRYLTATTIFRGRVSSREVSNVSFINFTYTHEHPNARLK